MQIHELPAGTPAAGMSFAGDTGSQTQKIDYDALADAILNKLTTKTFDIKSESQTIIAALNALGDAAKQGVANNLVTTGAGYLLDARQGKALSDLHATNADAIAALNSSIEGKFTPFEVYETINSEASDTTYTCSKNYSGSTKVFMIVGALPYSAAYRNMILAIFNIANYSKVNIKNLGDSLTITANSDYTITITFPSQYKHATIYRLQ